MRFPDKNGPTLYPILKPPDLPDLFAVARTICSRREQTEAIQRKLGTRRRTDQALRSQGLPGQGSRYSGRAVQVSSGRMGRFV
jgi:hypothetical protein